MTNDTMSGDYLNAITAERAAYQREYLRGGYSAIRLESMMDAHARTCARIIAQAYRNGYYSDMWRALSKATRNDMCASGTITNAIISHFISLAGWNDQLIDAAAFDCEAFACAVHDDAASTQTPGIPAGVWLLLDHLTGNANKSKTMTGLNAAAIGEHATLMLTASGNLATLAEHPKRYSDSISNLAVSAYLAGDHATRDFPTLTQVGHIIFQGNTETEYNVYPANYGVVHALCGSVTEAAKRWRQAITDAEETGDTKREVAARCAHMMLASSLLERGELTPGDLATLIDTMKETEETGGHTKNITIMTNDWTYGRPYNKITITSVGALIDEAAERMETR